MADLGDIFYSDKLINSLCENYSFIEENHRPILKEFLKNVGENYLIKKNNKVDKLTSKEIIRSIKKIKNQANKLNDELSNLTYPINEIFWEPELIVDFEMLNKDLSESSFGNSFSRYFDKDGYEIYLSSHKGTIYEALDLLNNYADYALNNLNNRKIGRPSNKDLRLWILSARELFIKIFKIDFTFDVHENGTPASHAYSFCIDALEALDSSITPQSIATTMRGVIKENNERNNRKN